MTKVHLEAVRFARDGYSIVLIGHKDHDEVIGTLGEVPERSYLVETVEDVDTSGAAGSRRASAISRRPRSAWMKPATSWTRLKQRFPLIQGPPAQDICYATENRQMAVKAVSPNAATCCWWWVRRTARIPSGWWKWATISACARTW